MRLRAGLAPSGSAQRPSVAGTGPHRKAAIPLLGLVLPALVLPALALLAGCAGTAARQGIEGPVRLGQLAYVGGPRVRPDSIVEDSRCPAGTQCVWAGRVVLRATVFGGSWSRQVDLTLGTPVPIADGTLMLVSVEPGRRPGKPELQRQLRFTFAFQGGL